MRISCLPLGQDDGMLACPLCRHLYDGVVCSDPLTSSHQGFLLGAVLGGALVAEGRVRALRARLPQALSVRPSSGQALPGSAKVSARPQHHSCQSPRTNSRMPGAERDQHSPKPPTRARPGGVLHRNASEVQTGSCCARVGPARRAGSRVPSASAMPRR